MPVLIAAVFVPRRLEWLSIDLRVGARRKIEQRLTLCLSVDSDPVLI
jgi:hypothetical protein